MACDRKQIALTIEFKRQLRNLLSQGQVTLAAVFAHQTKADQSFIDSVIEGADQAIVFEFLELLGELNGGSSL